MSRTIRILLAIAFAIVCTCSAAFALEFGVERVATGLDHPVYVTQAPGDTDLLYVLEQRLGNSTTGRISTVNTTTGVRETFITIDGLDDRVGFDDGGLHTMAFHPNFQSNGRFYVSWVDSQGDSRVDEFTAADGSVTMASEPILRYPTLAARPGRHSVAWVGFRPGATGEELNHLYITTGEGGFPEGSSSYVNVSQDLGTHYGKVLRVEVATGTDDYPADPNRNFGIPASNPYTSTADALGEVFHSGLRNPWRVSFDRATDDMYIGDVGWLTREEINFVRDGQQGLDFGWSSREGTIEVPGGSSPDMGGPLGDSVNPIFEYNHSTGVSVAGGYVYRGPIEDIQGDYFFADSFSGRIWTARFDRDTATASFNDMNLTGVTEISDDLQNVVDAGSITNVVSFGEDNAGNLYIVKIGDGGAASSATETGEIFRLVPLQSPGELEDFFLLVDPTTGAAQLRNQSGSDVTFDGYTISSASGALDPARWQSLDDLDGPGNDDGGWRESNASVTQLAELFQTGDFTMGNGQVFDFQELYEPNGLRDLQFGILLPGQVDTTPAEVVYATVVQSIASIDDLFVLVDPTTGDVQLRNQSGADVTFDGYTLASDSGALDPSVWQSLDDLDGPDNDDGGWRESNESMSLLAELLQSGDFTLADDRAIRLGEVFNTLSGMEDLVFEYLLPGQSEGTNVRVIYASIPEDPDFNGDGVVDAADYTVWRDQLGAEGIGLAADGDGNGIVDADDYTLWRSHFGLTLGASLDDPNVNAVPEPIACQLLAACGLVLAALVKNA